MDLAYRFANHCPIDVSFRQHVTQKARGRRFVESDGLVLFHGPHSGARNTTPECGATSPNGDDGASPRHASRQRCDGWRPPARPRSPGAHRDRSGRRHERDGSGHRCGTAPAPGSRAHGGLTGQSGSLRGCAPVGGPGRHWMPLGRKLGQRRFHDDGRCGGKQDRADIHRGDLLGSNAGLAGC